MLLWERKETAYYMARVNIAQMILTVACLTAEISPVSAIGLRKLEEWTSIELPTYMEQMQRMNPSKVDKQPRRPSLWILDL